MISERTAEKTKAAVDRLPRDISHGSEPFRQRQLVSSTAQPSSCCGARGAPAAAAAAAGVEAVCIVCAALQVCPPSVHMKRPLRREQRTQRSTLGGRQGRPRRDDVLLPMPCQPGAPSGLPSLTRLLDGSTSTNDQPLCGSADGVGRTGQQKLTL